MKRLITIIVGLMLFSFSFTTFALDIKVARVLTEPGDEDFKICRISEESLTASTEAALRANRIEVSQDRSTDPWFYVRITAIETSREFCAVMFELEVYTLRWIDLGLTDARKKRVFSKITLCNRTRIMSYPKQDVERRINERLKTTVDVCISEIAKM